MKILLTGHKGFIGGHLYRALQSDGHNITTYEWGDSDNNLSTVGLDWVIHIGAISSTTEKDVDKVMRQNYDFSCNLLDSALSNGVNFQYSSSASVYGLTSSFREDAPVDPKSPYAWSKYMFERFVQTRKEYAKSINRHIQGFRYFNVYGPEGEEHKGDQASPYYKFQYQAQTTGKIKLFEGSNLYLRDFVPVRTVVDVHLKFLNVDQSSIWNVGTGDPKSFLQVAKEIIKKYPADIEYVPMPVNIKDQYQKYTCADLTELKKYYE